MRGRIQKILIALNWKLNSDSKYTHISGNYISQALESLMCQKLKMLHNFWLMDQKLFWLGCMHTEFYADSDAKWVFSKFSIFQVNIPLRNFELHFAIFRKLRRQKKSKFHFLGQFLTLKNMVTKFFRNSNFSDFLGIKSEINQCGMLSFTEFCIFFYWTMKQQWFRNINIPDKDQFTQWMEVNPQR